MNDPTIAMAPTPISFLLQLGGLKKTKRTGWLRFIRDAESVADHTFRVAVLAFLAPPDLDTLKCIQMALVHDFGESIVGDIPTYAGIPKDQKHKLEKLAMSYLSSMLRSSNSEMAEKIMDLWLEYEAGATREAEYVKSADKFECLVQAFEYERDVFGCELGLEEFQGLAKKCLSPAIASWAQSLNTLRQRHIARPHAKFVFISGQQELKLDLGKLALKYSVEHIDVAQVVRSKSLDDTYPHSQVLKDYIAAGIDIPSSLSISLLESCIEATPASRPFLVSGFPIASVESFESWMRCHVYSIYVGLPSFKTETTWKVESDHDVLGRLRSRPLRHKDVPVDELSAPSEQDLEPVLASMLQQNFNVPDTASSRAIEEGAWTVEKALLELGIEPADDSLCDFYAFASRLKKIKRAGWLRYGIDAESIADHSCIMALLTFSLPEGLDTQKCTSMCLVHDLAEALVGDVTPMSGITKQEKKRREGATFQYITSRWPHFGERMKALWVEFEDGVSPESQHANDLDKIEMMCQAFEYEKQARVDLGEFFGASRKIVTQWGKTEAQGILDKRSKFWGMRLSLRNGVVDKEIRSLQDQYYD